MSMTINWDMVRDDVIRVFDGADQAYMLDWLEDLRVQWDLLPDSAKVLKKG